MTETMRDYQSIKARNAVLNLAETRAGALELRSMPRYVMIELTQGCNLRCPMCRSRQIAYREREFDRAIFDPLARVLFPAAEVIDIRGWGESLLAPDINNVIRLVAAHQARCRIVTNLSINRPDTLDLLIDTGAMVDVSLDSAEQGVLDVCRPGARLLLITRNLRRMVSRLDGQGRPASGLRIIATLQSTTLAGLPDLVRYTGRIGVRQIVLNEVTVAPGDPNAVAGLEAEVDLAIARATTVADELGVDLYAGTALGSCVGVRKDSPFCIHPWAYATVGYDGSIGYCDHLIGPMMAYSCMGNVTVSSFREIWNGPAWRELRRWHSAPERRDVAAYHPCYRCYQHRNVDFEDIFEPRLQRYRLNIVPRAGQR
ncbi:MAG: SPASM domain-containing protein [Pseudonocardiaceae bacterium]